MTTRRAPNCTTGFFLENGYGLGQVIATSNSGATMADRKPGKSLKKSGQSIKEKRAEKRERAADAGELIKKRKRH
ncbi:hypothetical protein LCL87_03065 [Rhodococcus hoagii]|nr:hypothetical protein [Prescottella equi]